MNASQPRTFHYHADGSAFGGHISEPFQAVIPTQASASLAQAGGYAHASIGSFRVQHVVSVKNAWTEIYGTSQKEQGTWTSMVTCVVEGLNVLDIVKADSIIARLTVRHPHKGYYPTVAFAGSQFTNLTIGGKLVEPKLDHAQFARSTAQRDAVHGPWESDERLVGAAVKQSRSMIEAEGAPDWLKSRYAWVGDPEERRRRGHIECSLVTHLIGAEPKDSFGHVLRIADVGNLFFSELAVDQGTFRLTMLRIEMGCLADGDLSVATANSNGRPSP